MGTGLTFALDDNNLSASRWVLEVLSLQCFGAFYDISFGRNEEQLAEVVSKDSDFEYHMKKLEETKQRQKETSKWVKEQWQKEYEEVAKHITSENIKSVKESSELKAKHDAVYADLENLYGCSKDEFVRDVAKMGMKQLGMCESETKPYIASIPCLEKYIEEQKAVIKRDLKYHTEEAKERLGVLKKNIEAYDTLRKETHRILDPQK